MTAMKLTRRSFLAAAAGSTALGRWSLTAADSARVRPAQIAITFDLEMSRDYPRRGMTEWDYEKGNLDQATKDYSLQAAQLVQELGGVIHFFCVGRVLEQPDVAWLRQIAQAGHPIGNHTYDHISLLARDVRGLQFRFQRAPWLVEGKTVTEAICENIRLTTEALRERCDVTVNGFRTPGGFPQGLAGREDLQQLLLDQGFTWISSKYPAHRAGQPGQEPSAEDYGDIVRAQEDAQPFVYPTGLVEIPMSPISDVSAFRSRYWRLDYFLKAIRLGVERAIAVGGVFDLLCHPSCMLVEDPGFETIKLICELTRQAGEHAEIVGLDAVAQRLRG